VQRVNPATFRLVQPDGRAVPAGAVVQLNGGTFVVALDGLTYVTTLDHGVGASAQWEGERCAFRVGPPPQDDPLPDLGTIVCQPQHAN
jgi:outer membrane usher protein